MPVFLVGSMAVQLESSLKFGPGELGFIVAGYYLGAAVLSMPLARVVEWLGALRTLRVACATSALLEALIPLYAHSWSSLLGFLIPCGVATAAIQPASNVLLAARIPSEIQGVAFGLKQAAVPAATFLSGLVVPLIALTIGWRWGYLIAAVAAACMAIMCPRPSTSLSERRKRRRPAGISMEDRRHLVVLTVGFALGVGSSSALTAFVASSAVSIHMSRAAAGLMVGVGGASAAVSRVLTGIVADRRGGEHLRAIARMILMGACGYGVLSVATGAGLKYLYPAAVGITFAAGWGWNGLFNLALVRNHGAYAARATAITQTGGRMASMVGPFLFGLGASHLSYAVAWLITSSLVAVAAAVVFFSDRLRVVVPGD